jgi:hypothetical protein
MRAMLTALPHVATAIGNLACMSWDALKHDGSSSAPLYGIEQGNPTEGGETVGNRMTAQRRLPEKRSMSPCVCHHGRTAAGALQVKPPQTSRTEPQIELTY